MLKKYSQLGSDAFKQLFEGMGDASLIFKDGHFISANQAAVDLLGYPDKAMLIKRLQLIYDPPSNQMPKSWALKQKLWLLGHWIWVLSVLNGFF